MTYWLTLFARYVVFLLPYVCLGVALEALWVLPCVPSRRDLHLNLHFALLHVTLDLVATVTLLAFLVRVTARVPGYGALVTWWPVPTTPIGRLGTACLWIVLGDFFSYWVHRAQHASPILWAAHAVHHSDPAMNLTTAFRQHWPSETIASLGTIVPMIYLFAIPADIVLIGGMLRNALVFGVHANTSASLGRGHWLIGNPAVHRIHHSTDPRHINKNFAAVWPIWDVLFGTYVAPTSGEFPETGLRHGAAPDSLWQALVMPFRTWAQSEAIRRLRRNR